MGFVFDGPDVTGRVAGAIGCQTQTHIVFASECELVVDLLHLDELRNRRDPSRENPSLIESTKTTKVGDRPHELAGRPRLDR